MTDTLTAAPRRAISGYRSMAELFQATAEANAGRVALRTPGDETRLTWQEYRDRVERLAAGLAGLGVRPGDSVAIMLVNRPEMHLFDAAAFHLGAIPFSVYNTSSPEQLAFITGSTRPRTVVTEAQFLAPWLTSAAGDSLEHVVCVDGTDAAGVLNVADVEAAGDPAFDFTAAWRAVGPDDVLTIIHTSGTTGDPKGVAISHRNMLAELDATASRMNAGPEDRILSFLPSAHIADRWAGHYLQIAAGNELTSIPDRRLLMPTMAAVHPTLFGAVPGMWQKVRAAIEGALEAEPDAERREGAQRAVAFAKDYVIARNAGTATAEQAARYAAIDAQMLAPIRQRLGLDQARVVQSGAAPIPLDIVVFFNALGIPLSDAWGMSEVSCLAAMHPVGAERFGTVGTAIDGAEIAVSADGELLIRGDIVMAAYLGRPDLYAETVDTDGWVHTGDVGSIDADGYVTLVDRKKELLINASGKNMSPANIESAIKAGSSLIAQAVAIGDGRTYNVALIVLDAESAVPLAARLGVEPDPAVLAGHPAVMSVVDTAVQAANARLNRAEQIKKYAILPEFWEPGTDVLTHTMKLRRRPIDERYRAEITALYA